jgi:hypothetical protein
MPFDLADLKRQARKVVHDTMSVPAVYENPALPGSVDLRVRWHNKIAINGDLVEAGYAEMIEGINRVIFEKAELDEKGVNLARGHKLTVWDGTVLMLDSQEPAVGPVTVIWRVVQS